ncbi:tRNA (uridine(54)-C5)-methyltransferase TrmA [Sulfurimonas sp. MAG313]|nr:tRNA (uridine(54)-C5)-methyltransferase TrmA [Sulfurimonas sp. MAG313]MDF1880677.1 tRNA (uridine(54)-C5)-methyltransferase TrmA [Sulfurimonas sp. MAG313]
MNCEYFGVCGSCKLYELSYEEQLEQKLTGVKNLFSQLYSGSYDISKSKEEHYRARSEFKLWHNGDELSYAMNTLDKQGVVMVDSCSMVNEHIKGLMPRLIQEIHERKMGTKLFNVDFLSTTKGEIVVSLIYHIKLDEAWNTLAKKLSQDLGIHIIGRSRKQKVIVGQDYVTESLTFANKEYTFKQIENAFTQPNPYVNEQMVTWAMNQAKGSTGDLLELYCGSGNFTIPFAQVFDKVLATEISKSSINAAKENMVLNDTHNIEFVRMSAQEFTQALDGAREFRRMKDINLDEYTLQTLFVDPPRAGLDEEAREFCKRFEHIIYISCNPETLVRDLEDLSCEYEIVQMAAFDQFPYTPHLEMGAVLKKKLK